MSERNRYLSQQKLPTLDIPSTYRVPQDYLIKNITVHTGDAQFFSFRSLNELNPKFPLPHTSLDSSTQLNSTIQTDLSQNKKIIEMLGKTLYQQKNDYERVQETMIKKMRTVTRMQRSVKKIPHKIEFQESIPLTNAQQQYAKKKVSFPIYFNGAFFSKLQHSWLPSVRESTMAADNFKKVYIFGGIGSEVLCDLIEYDIPQGKFRELQQNGDMPLSRYGHCFHFIGYPLQLSTQFSYDNPQSSPINGKQLIMFGGEMQYNSALRLRENLSDTRIYDIDSSTWQILKPNIENIPESRRSFGSCIVGKGLIVMGGIRSRFSVFNDLHYLNLSQCKWTPLETQKNPYIKGLAFQSLICTYSKPQYIFEKREARQKPYKAPDHEGIYCFGGCYFDDDKSTLYYNNFMALLKLDQPNNPWSIVETSGKQPDPRIQHSATFLQDMNVIIIFGGRDDSKVNPYFNDLFAYKLIEKEWVLLQIYGEIPRPRASHSAVSFKSQVLFFGGVNLNGYLEFAVNIAEFNQNQIRQLQAEYKSQDKQDKRQEYQQKDDDQKNNIEHNKVSNKLYSLHTIIPTQQIQKLTKTEERNNQIQQLSFSNFPKHLK